LFSIGFLLSSSIDGSRHSDVPMPFYTKGEANPEVGFDPDKLPNPALVYGEVADDCRWGREPHAHGKAQLTFAGTGSLTCAAGDKVWVVAQQCGLWVPSGVVHDYRARRNSEAYALYVPASIANFLPEDCCALSVTPLLAELLKRAARLPIDFHTSDSGQRLTDVIFDELRAAKSEPQPLPMAKDERLRVELESLMEDPGLPVSGGDVALRLGCSERSFERLMQREVGMSFGHWRRRLQVMAAIRQLQSGARVQHVAFDLGYGSVSAFSTMFRKMTGRAPGHYMSR